MVRRFAFLRGLLSGHFLWSRSTILAAICGAVAGGWFAAPCVMAEPGDTTPPPPPATQPTTEPGSGARHFDDVRADLDVQGRALAKVLPALDSLFDETKRAQVAPQALPVLKKMADLLDEAMVMIPQSQQLQRVRLEISAMMSLLDDKGGTLYLRKEAVSNDEEEAASATAWEYLIAFAHAAKNIDGQKKALGDLTALARGNTTNDMIAQAASLMIPQAANAEISAAAEKIITDVLKGPMAERMAAELVRQHKLLALENKPMVIEGAKVDGSAFSTSNWKGKVVLVDFWATWCPPCMHEFPHIKKVYDDYHGKGLEIIGVSCDTDADGVKNFLAVNPGLAWPELFDPASAARSHLHPLALQFGVNLPTLFLIDRKGILRTVDAQANLDALIQKLLAEPAE
jgi:thiol-disulfide isomerase/thioredoxin